jgi:hypothetical protein
LSFLLNTQENKGEYYSDSHKARTNFLVGNRAERGSQLKNCRDHNDYRYMTTEFNQLLNDSFGDLGSDKLRVWLIGDREQVAFAIHEFMIKQIASDRAKFTPIVPFPSLAGKYMSILVR